jgi:hypothetical protein
MPKGYSTKVGPFKCDKCNYITQNLIALSGHKSHHVVRDQKVGWGDIKERSCKHCGIVLVCHVGGLGNHVGMCGKNPNKTKQNMWPDAETFKRMALIADSPYPTGSVRRCLFKFGLKKPACEICGWAEKNPHWGKIMVQLDHINGINTDQRLENLRVLCPNHHALTKHYMGYNHKKFREKRDGKDS